MSEPCKLEGCHNMALLAIPACEFCKKRYCTAHMLPEVHGCRNACKNQAQRDSTRDANEQRQARKHVGNDDAKKRLDKKLENSEAARRKKGPQKK